jgi:hypothetical protein
MAASASATVLAGFTVDDFDESEDTAEEEGVADCIGRQLAAEVWALHKLNPFDP